MTGLNTIFTLVVDGTVVPQGNVISAGLLAPVLGILTIIIGGWLSAWLGGSLWPVHWPTPPRWNTTLPML